MSLTLFVSCLFTPDSPLSSSLSLSLSLCPCSVLSMAVVSFDAALKSGSPGRARRYFLSAPLLFLSILPPVKALCYVLFSPAKRFWGRVVNILVSVFRSIKEIKLGSMVTNGTDNEIRRVWGSVCCGRDALQVSAFP